MATHIQSLIKRKKPQKKETYCLVVHPTTAVDFGIYEGCYGGKMKIRISANEVRRVEISKECANSTSVTFMSKTDVVTLVGNLLRVVESINIASAEVLPRI